MDLVETIQDIFSANNEIPPNESNTCDWIILPILLAIGYDRRDIHSRIADGAGKFPDYTILPNDKVRQFYLEAKSWAVELQDDHAIQALNYANANGKRWVVLSNGQCWRLYDNRIQGQASEKLVTEVYNEDLDRFVQFLTAIGKDSVLANRIEDFAASEIESKKRAAEQRILMEARNERRRKLSRLIEQSVGDVSSPLSAMLVEYFKKQPGLDRTTMEDVASMLRLLKPEAEGVEVEIATLTPTNGQEREVRRAPTDTEKLRLRFWTELLRKAKLRTDLHADISPGTDSWYSCGAGRAGLSFNYCLGREQPRVELSICTGDAIENKRIFDQLQRARNQVEESFGSPLVWDRLDDKQTCRIRFKLEPWTLHAEKNWPEVQEKMIEAMIRFEKALRSELDRME
jgi:predicted type IV restriction endonuclease